MYDSLREAVRAVCGEGITVRSRVPSTGGDINRGWTLALSDGGRIFMKENRRENLGFFTAEAKGLEVIRQTGAVRVPEVLALGTDGENACLLLEDIEPGRGGRASSEELGRGLARMHRADTKALVPGGKFGFSEDNYIGAGAQINTPKQTWREFFIRCRLLPQFRRAEEYFDRPERKRIEAFLTNVGRHLTEPEKPALLHGDLWAGNTMTDRDGRPWLIDPAAYVGHPEADLAMTELFGGFDRAFYDAYREEAGIDPGYEDRRELYNLYHLLNHLNLFGRGYLQAVRGMLRRYA